ncbi:hypothetical protein NC653_032146 [Populus alba x Populus x berolinensis]|uniref:Uncharacterized protein n=1 Tax=Populus alba x Populus x berolinensis TaxID=444605 RepID=A0AAD6LQV2_9ROSI|nr:hypothetical protein NC653_032146 [Populus alba x Populus x berolinensis]
MKLPGMNLTCLNSELMMIHAGKGSRSENNNSVIGCMN